MSPLHNDGEDDYSEDSDADSVWRESDDWLYENLADAGDDVMAADESSTNP